MDFYTSMVDAHNSLLTTCSTCHMHENNQVIGFFDQNKNNGGIVSNLDHEIKKMKQNTCKQESNKIL